MPRFYTPDIELVANSEVELSPLATHHAMRVLRMHEGDAVEVFDGKGCSATGTIRFAKDYASVLISAVNKQDTESLRIILLQALVSNDKMDWIVEKACETDVTRLIAFTPARTDIKLNQEKIVSRLHHWNKVAISACEQCGRNTLPEIVFCASLQEASAMAEGLKIILHPHDRQTEKTKRNIKAVSFLIGPEGGFTDQEVRLAKTQGFIPKQLGNLILRTETAGIVAAAYAQTLWGAFKG